MTLENPFPSSPKNPPQHVIYIGLHNVICLGAIYAAHRLVVKYCLKDREYRWINDTTLMTLDSILKIRSETLKDIIAYEPTKEEEKWWVPEPHRSQWLKLARRAGNDYFLTELQDEEAVIKKNLPTVGLPDPIKKKIDQKRRVKKALDENTRSIGDIAQRIGIKPSEARAILRAQKISKPYVWNNQDANDIEKLLQKHRKK